MSKYTKSCIVNYAKDVKLNCITVDETLKKVDIDENYTGKVYIIPYDFTKVYCLVAIFYEDYCSVNKVKFHDGYGRNGEVIKEIITNRDAIIAGTYESENAKKKMDRKEKREAADERKKEREKEKMRNKKTIAVDFFSEDENGIKDQLLDALTETGSILCNGEYVDIVLNGLITFEYRTTSKRRDLGYSVKVLHRSPFVYDTKEGDLWEDLDDNFERELFSTIIGGCLYDNEMTNVLEFLDMYVKKYKVKYSDNANVLEVLDLLEKEMFNYSYNEKTKRYVSETDSETRFKILETVEYLY